MIDTQAELDALRRLLQEERRVLAEALSATDTEKMSPAAQKLRERFTESFTDRLLDQPEALRRLLGQLQEVVRLQKLRYAAPVIRVRDCPWPVEEDT